MNINQFPVQQTYVGNCFELAQYIEFTLAQYLVFPKVDPALPQTSPPRPSVGVAIVTAFVNLLVQEAIKHQTQQVPQTFEDAMLPFIKEEWQFSFDEEHKRNILNHELFTRLRGLLVDVRTDVKIFLGMDRWVMHEFQSFGSDYYVYKGVDFRIADWTRRMEEGEWESALVPQEALTANEQALRDETKHRQKEAKDKQEHLAHFGKI